METKTSSGAGPGGDPLFGANHFTLLRWFLACAVVVGHAWMIPTGYEPTRIHDWTFSYLAVNGFFILSGLLSHQEPLVRKAYGNRGLALVHRVRKDGWSSLVFRKN